MFLKVRTQQGELTAVNTDRVLELRDVDGRAVLLVDDGRQIFTRHSFNEVAARLGAGSSLTEQSEMELPGA